MDTPIVKADSALSSALWTLRPRNEPCNGKYTLKSASNCGFSSAVKIAKISQIPLSGLQCKKSDFLNTFSGLTPVFFETKGKIRGKYEQSKDIKMYARKSGFVTKITKNDDKSYDTERAKVRKNALKVGKSRKNHKNTPDALKNTSKKATQLLVIDKRG